jgi:transposase
LAEFGVVAAHGKSNFAKLVAGPDGEAGAALPAPALEALKLIAAQIDDGNEKIEALEKVIVAEHRSSKAIASAIAASVPDPAVFRHCYSPRALRGPDPPPS